MVLSDSDNKPLTTSDLTCITVASALAQ